MNYFYTAGSRNGLEGVVSGGPGHKKEVEKEILFAIEKYVEDVKQEEKDVLDPVQSIIRPTHLVKEELRRILFKMSQFLGCHENRRIPAGGQHSLLA